MMQRPPASGESASCFSRSTSARIFFSCSVALGALRHVRQLVAHAHVGVAAELDVGAAPRHVGGDRHRAGNAGLRDDIGLLLVVAGVQDREDLLLRFRPG